MLPNVKTSESVSTEERNKARKNENVLTSHLLVEEDTVANFTVYKKVTVKKPKEREKR